MARANPVSAAALGLALAACSAEPDELAAPELADLSARVFEPDYTLALAPADTRVAHLTWHTPTCPLAYRVRVDEAYPEGLEKFLNTQPEHSASFFAVAPAITSTATSPAT